MTRTRRWRWSELAKLAVAAAAWSGCAGREAAPPSHVGPDPALADTLMARIAAAYDLSRPDAADRMAALYPDTGRVISAGGGRLTTVVDSIRLGIAEFWANVGRNMEDPRWEWDEVFVERLGPDGAVLTGAWRISHRAPTGRPHVLQGAWTAVFRRIDGEWTIVAEHLSAP